MNKFACRKTEIEGGKIDGNGKEFFSICLKCALGDNGVCAGHKIVCENNHIKQTYEIFTKRGSKYIETLTKGKDEILTFDEFKNYVEQYKKDVK